MKLLIGYGTRPEFIKIKPLLNKLKNIIDYKTVFTGQHLDIIDNDLKPDYILNILNGENRLDNVLSSSLNQDIFDGITHTLVQGDTTSALSLSLASFHRKIKVIHLEAGLRTYDYENPYPEEMNRQLISRISDINLCPTRLNSDNLKNEKVKGDIYVVGNTVLDNLVNLRNDCEYTDKVLITLHRRENHDIIKEWFSEINILAEKFPNLEFILPIHPNPNVQKFKNILQNVKVIKPLNHLDLLNILIKCKLIISDSGGLQEEASFFNKKIIVCRKITERPESINIHSFMCKEPKNLDEMFNYLIYNYKVDAFCPYGNGNSSEEIVKILKEYE